MSEGPWYDKKLLSIGDLDITVKHAGIGTGTTVAIILVAVGICTFISYRKRKTIAVHA